MAETHFSGPVVSTGGFQDDNGILCNGVFAYSYYFSTVGSATAQVRYFEIPAAYKCAGVVAVTWGTSGNPTNPASFVVNVGTGAGALDGTYVDAQPLAASVNYGSLTMVSGADTYASQRIRFSVDPGADGAISSSSFTIWIRLEAA